MLRSLLLVSVTTVVAVVVISSIKTKMAATVRQVSGSNLTQCILDEDDH